MTLVDDMSPMGEMPPLPPSLIRELRRDYRARLYDWAWQQMADKAVTVFEEHRRRN